MTVPARQRASASLRSLSGSAVGVVAKHRLFAGLFALGVALRIVTTAAYRPVIFGPDAYWYLEQAYNLGPAGVRPVGYSAFLRLLQPRNGLEIIPVVNHLLGLAVAAGLYVVLLRLGVRRWLAALAAAPVLLDAYQLNVEQQILSENLFVPLLVLACVLLLWRRPLAWYLAAGAGLAVALAGLTRPLGVLVVLPALAVVLAARARPSRLLAAVSFLALFAAPLGAYMVSFHERHGTYALSRFEGRFLYGRVVRFADCDKLEVPPRQRPLCPDLDAPEQPSIATLLWSKSGSPIRRLDPPRGTSANDLAEDFSKRAIRRQPLDYGEAVARDFLRSFALRKRADPGEFGIDQWQFQDYFPIHRLGQPCPPPEETEPGSGCANKRKRALLVVEQHGSGTPLVREGLAGFLRTYQRFAYTPGPLLAAALVVALAAVLGLGRARGSGLRSATLLFAGTGLVLSLGSVALTVFSWRYQLSLIVFLPPALALGLTALLSGKPGDPEAPSDPVISPGLPPDGLPRADPRPEP